MEDVYSIKVKTKPDTRNVYPSERRYSASTVSGLAWVHFALAATSFLLACLAIVNPNNESIEVDKENSVGDQLFSNLSLEDTQDLRENTTLYTKESNTIFLLVLAPSLLTIFALAAGLAALLASTKWYIDRNITWLFCMSVLSTVFSLASFILILSWFVHTSEGNENISDFYKDNTQYADLFFVKHADVVDRNTSHIVISKNSTGIHNQHAYLFTKRVLSINILIAAFLEFLWSLLSMKIAFKGMRNNYKDDNEDRRGNCVSVVTKVKGNNANKLPKHIKIFPPKPDLLDHYPSRNINRIFKNSNDRYFIKNENNEQKQNTETSSEIYKERMMNFLNRCGSSEMVSECELSHRNSEPALNTIIEGINMNDQRDLNCSLSRMTPLSWGDAHDYTVYNQNTINFEKIFKFDKKNQDGGEECVKSDEPSEIMQS